MLGLLCTALAEDVWACVLIGQVVSLGLLIVVLTMALVLLLTRGR